MKHRYVLPESPTLDDLFARPNPTRRPVRAYDPGVAVAELASAASIRGSRQSDVQAVFDAAFQHARLPADIGPSEARAWLSLLAHAAEGPRSEAEARAHLEEFSQGSPPLTQDEALALCRRIPREVYHRPPTSLDRQHSLPALIGFLLDASLGVPAIVALGRALREDDLLRNPAPLLTFLRPVAPGTSEHAARVAALCGLSARWIGPEHLASLLEHTFSPELVHASMRHFAGTASSRRDNRGLVAVLRGLEDPDAIYRCIQASEIGPYSGTLVNLCVARLVMLDARPEHVLAVILRGQEWKHAAAAVVTRLESPCVAEVAFGLIQRGARGPLKSALESQGAFAVEGLVAMCARPGKKRSFALDVLAGFVARGDAALVRQHVAQTPARVAGELMEALFPASSEDTSEAMLPESAFPDWLRDIVALPASHHNDRCPAHGKPPLRLRDDPRPLPEEATALVLAAFHCGSVYGASAEEQRLAQQAFAALDRMRPTLDPDSAEALWWAVWSTADAQGSDYGRWQALEMVGALGHQEVILFVGDLLARMDKALGRTEYCQGPWNAVRGLLKTGEPLAYQQLTHAALVTRGKLAAGRRLRSALPAFGLEHDRFMEEHIPQYGLDAQGQRLVDYGPRRFTVRLGHGAKLEAIDIATGKTLASLPSAKSGESAEVVDRHRLRFKREQKQILAMRAHLVAELEADLGRPGTWSLDELAAYRARSPLHRALTREVLFGIYDASGALVFGFTFDADGEPRGQDGELVALPSDGQVGLVAQDLAD